MAAITDLLRPESPRFLTVDCDDAAFGRLYLRLLEEHPSATVRLIRGKRSRKAGDFLAETAAALQFPLYFGGGWNGFEECIRQYWIPTSAIVGLVAGAESLFADDTESAWEAFTGIVNDTRDAPGPSVRFLFQAGGQAARLLRSHIESHGGSVANIALP
jgi:hypothetical protein